MNVMRQNENQNKAEQNKTKQNETDVRRNNETRDDGNKLKKKCLTQGLTSLPLFLPLPCAGNGWNYTYFLSKFSCVPKKMISRKKNSLLI